MAAAGVTVKEVATTKIDGQKTGTSGLRKKAKEFSSGSYLANWVQSLFNALPKEQRVRARFWGLGCARLRAASRGALAPRQPARARSLRAAGRRRRGARRQRRGGPHRARDIRRSTTALR